MARAFAGTMGYLGMAVTLLRGAVAGAGIEATLSSAIIAMIALAIVGGVVGAIAKRTVDESVRSQLERQLAEAGDSQTTPTVTAT